MQLLEGVPRVAEEESDWVVLLGEVVLLVLLPVVDHEDADLLAFFTFGEDLLLFEFVEGFNVVDEELGAAVLEMVGVESLLINDPLGG